MISNGISIWLTVCLLMFSSCPIHHVIIRGFGAMAIAAVIHSIVFLPCLLCFMAIGLEKFEIEVRMDMPKDSGLPGRLGWNNLKKYQRGTKKLGDVNINMVSLGRFDEAEER